MEPAVWRGQPRPAAVDDLALARLSHVRQGHAGEREPGEGYEQQEPTHLSSVNDRRLLRQEGAVLRGAGLGAAASSASRYYVPLMTTYPQALLYGAVSGLAMWLGVAASDNSTLGSAAPYAAGAGIAVVLAMCAFIAYRNGRPPRR